MNHAPNVLLTTLALVAASSVAVAQEPDDAATVERVFVPEGGFERVLRKHPRGLLVDESELSELLSRANANPPLEAPDDPAPVATVIERVRLTGRVKGEIATLRAEADVAVLGTGPARLRLPLSGIGLRQVRLGRGDSASPAQVIRTRAGHELLLPGGQGAHRVSWTFAVRVAAGDERGSGSFEIPVPEAASGRLEIVLDGDLEVLPTSQGASLWVADPASETSTTIQGAFGGEGEKTIRIAVRPRRSVQDVTAYTVAETRSAYLVQPGVVTLDAAVRLEVYRAPRDRFQLTLPKGFVVRALSLSQGELSYVQRGERVDVVLDAPRRGVLGLRVRAERASEDQKAKGEQLVLAPLGLPDLDRVSGVMGLASGSDAEVGFEAVTGLERADLSALDVRRAGLAAAASGTLLRVYRRGAAAGAGITLAVKAVKPRVDLSIKGALALSKREVRAVTLFRFEVEAGTVYVFRAYLPSGYAFETATVRDGERRALPHQRKERLRKTRSGRELTEVTVELERGLKAGERLLLTVQATAQSDRDLAGTRLAIPRFVGAPAERTHGHLGFAPDDAFRLAGGQLDDLVAIPAEELPRVGVDVAGLVLGYRIEGASYGGQLEVLAKETQISAEVLTSHLVHERVIDTNVTLRLDVEGAPLETLDVLLPEGSGLLAKIEAPDLKEDRELIKTEAGGLERWRLFFDRRKTGRFDVTIGFGTKLGASESKTTQAALPRVTLGEGAFRERGTLAIYSSDATELRASAEGLQEIEVTEVPGELTRGDERPLFAYTHVQPDYSAALTITRHGTSEVLTAVVEQLALASSVGPDGTARHTATFSLKNLNNQFFGLKLPEGATLWSVTVDGKGVKPAEHGGFRVIPIPAGEERASLEATVKATYTFRGTPWGVTGKTGLVAPTLLREGEAVPVLRTQWQLHLPDDYRVVDVAGNLDGGDLVRAAPIALSTWSRVSGQPWVPLSGLLVLLGLGIAASPKLQGRLVLDLANTGTVASGVVGGVARVFTLKRIGMGCALVVGLLVVGGGCLVLSVAGRSSAERGAPASPMHTPKPMADSRSAGGGGGVGGAAAGRGGAVAFGGELAEVEFEQADEGSVLLGASAEANVAKRARDSGGRRRPERRRLKGKREDSAPAQKAKRPAPSAPPRSEAAPMPMDAAPMEEESMDEDFGAEGDEADDMAEPESWDKLVQEARKELSQPRARAAMDPSALADRDEARGGRKLRLGSKDSKNDGLAEKPVIVLDETVDLTGDIPKGTDMSKFENKPVQLAKVHGDLGSFGQVGLRSLVMNLSGVGHAQSFSRTGGAAQLEVSFVREAALVTSGGFLALAGFLAVLLLPRSGKLSTVGLVAVGLGALTAIPLVVGDMASTPLLNALALGLLVGVPVASLAALGRVWGSAPFTRLRHAAQAARAEREAQQAAERAATNALRDERTSGARPSAGALLPLVFALFFGSAQAQDAPQVFVPYDPADGTPAAESGKIYVPLDVYEALQRRGNPGAGAPEAAPVVDAVISETRYTGTLEGGALTLSADVRVGVLAKGWQTVSLGLTGCGLKRSSAVGTHEDANVKVAPAGGFQLVAKGPGSYRVTLELVVPNRSGNFSFAAVPCVAATLAVTTSDVERRLVVDGARAQEERRDGGRVVVDASLGDAAQISLGLRSREVLSAGASEASANTQSVVWVRRGRAVLLSETRFTISGAGREGFRFAVPKGFQVTEVETQGLRSWRQDGEGVEVSLRRPTGRTASVKVAGELVLGTDATAFDAPQVVAQGVSRESGVIGICVEDGLRVRSARDTRLRQVDGGAVTGLARTLGAGGVERAYGFARRPAELPLELISEAVEVKAETRVKATVLSDLYLVEARLSYDVSRGKLYQLEVSAPTSLERIGAPEGLDVREVTLVPQSDEDKAEGRQRYRLGLATGLSGTGVLSLTFAQRLSFGERTELAFPDVRPSRVARETGTIAIGAGANLEIRVPSDPSGLAARDVKSAGRSLGAAPSGARWKLAYQRPNGRVAGLAKGVVNVKRPRPYVTGSWVLHARVERDVVRYTLRALYEIENAGVQRFQLVLPESAGERVTVDAQNQREVTSVVEGGARTYTVELQSPAEVFYDLALSWEEVLSEGKPFSVPQVGIDGVNRKVRGFVLLEKAPEVVDVLEERSRVGVAKPARAADAPALPPGKGASDFVKVYQVPLSKGEEWAVTCGLKRGEVKLPAPAMVPFAHLQSVFTKDGEVRHRIRYRVRNLSLQFLTLRLPPKATVWSVFVDGKPKRLHHEGELSLIPLPKRSAADLSFDVELIYATPPAGAFGFGERLALVGPVLETEKVKAEKTFWTVYTPQGFDCSGFGGNAEVTAAQEADAVLLQADVQEYGRLAELAERTQGKQQQVADANLARQEARITQQMKVCDTSLRGSFKGGSVQTATKSLQEAQQVVGDNNRTYKQLNQQIVRRRQADSKEQKKRLAGQQLLSQDQLDVQGNTFERTQSGWATNKQIFKKGNRVQWAGVGDKGAQNDPNAPAQQGKAQERYTLSIEEGQKLDLSNVKVNRESQDQQRQRGANYGYYAQRAQKVAEQANRREIAEGQVARISNVVFGDEWGQRDRTATPRGTSDEGQSSDGLLSIRVAFATPGVARSFATESQEAPNLTFKVYPEDADGNVRSLGMGLVLLLLLVGVIRLGLLAPLDAAQAGAAGRRVLALVAAVGLGAAVFAHPAGAVLTLLLSLWAIRHGRLGGAAELA